MVTENNNEQNTQADGSSSSLALSRHVRPFYSLDEVKDEQGLRKYWKRFSELRYNFSPTVVDRYYLDCKLTGVPVQLYYLKGTLVSALTKYDGKQGEDVTDAVAHLPNVPQRIKTERTVVIRGEIVIHRDDFYVLNQDRENSGLPTFDTMPDCVVDTLHSGNVKLISKYILRFYAWELFVHGAPEMAQELQIERLVMFGFNVPRGQICTGVESMISFINEIARIRNNLPYEINGVVIKQNDPEYRKAIGTKDGIELAKCVWRFNSGGVACYLTGIDWRVQRTGRLSPVGRIKPVSLNGLTITEVSLRSYMYVKDQHIGDNAKIVLDRSGENTPTIIKILKTGDYTGVPEVCPCCGEPLVIHKENAYCRNPNCSAILEATLNFVVGKEALNYSDITPEFIHAAVQSKTITSLIDIFTTLESKSKEVVQEELDRLVVLMRNINTREFIILLGIPGMGKAIASKLAMEAGTLEGLVRILNNAEYFRLLGISSVVKKNLKEWYDVPEHKKFLEDAIALKLPKCS